ncbi:MAG: hypothetical protein ACKVHO_19570 [Verrucomicrobiia bacterium]|jgi:hypothetical protein
MSKTPIVQESAGGLDLPKAPAWWSTAPKGSIDDGIRMSELVIANFENTRPELFIARRQAMTRVEFVL